MDDALIYAHAKQSVHLDQFKDLLRIPSVSTDSLYQQDVDRAADWIVDEAIQIGLKNVKKMPTALHPIVYADWLDAGPDKPTVLFYAHYDVQPPDPLELWESPPFDPSERDGRLYCRGAIDDKPGVFMTLKAFEAYFQTVGRLPINVKVLFEGEEEIGSPSIELFLAEYGEQFRADALVINDGIHSLTRPIIPLGARGIIGGEVIVQGPVRDLHSGTFGGWVENPLHVAARIIASVHDQEGRISIPHYYDEVEPLTNEDRDIVQRAVENPDFIDGLLDQAKVKKPYWGEAVAPLGVRMWGLPTFDVNGMTGGYQGKGTKTIIPAEASFKFTSRLSPNQNPQHAMELLRDHFMGFADANIEIQIEFEPSAWPVKTTREGPIAKAIHEALRVAWDKEPLLYPEGGSVPLLGIFDRKLKMPLLDMAYVTGQFAHSPNENILLKSFHIGIETAIHFIRNVAMFHQ